LETYISLLLMIVPGFIARKIYEQLNYEPKSKSDFETTIVSLIYSTIIITLNYIVLAWFFKVEFISVNDVVKKFSTTIFVIEYAFLSIIMSIIVALLHNHYNSDIERHINNIRKKAGKTELVDAETIWAKVFIDGQQHAVLIDKDNNEYAKGFVHYTSPPDGQEKELFLIREDIINNNPDLFDAFKGVYIDFDKNIKIKEYSLVKFNNELKKTNAK
jgi:hypothetical protein